MFRIISRIAVCMLTAVLSVSVVAQERAAYKIYTSEGKKTDYGKMISKISSADVIFVGETHNCPIAHWIEYIVTEDIANRYPEGLVLGAEMLERDNQLLVDEYVNKTIDSDKFESEAKIWGNHSTDYAPLMFLARDYSLRFVATNVPRRYASFVKDNGLDTLLTFPEQAKKLMAPLPIQFEETEEDKAMFGMMMAISGHRSEKSYFAEAQALKDATMAWSIAENFDKKFIHYNGNFHSDYRGGIIPYLNQYRPGLKIATICCVRQETIEQLDEENLSRADFIVVVPESMPSTL